MMTDRSSFRQNNEVLPTDTADDVAKKVHQLEYDDFPEIIEKVVLSLWKQNFRILHGVEYFQ